jgi:hypothetical protein
MNDVEAFLSGDVVDPVDSSDSGVRRLQSGEDNSE